MVISIIGLLSTLAMVSLNNARIRARDTIRLATLRQIYKQISILDTELTCQFSPGGGVYNLKDCSGTVGNEAVDFSKFIDPIANQNNACHTSVGVVPCSYSIGPNDGSSNDPTKEFFQVCSWLEGDSSGFPSGLINIDNTGNIQTGCDLTIS